MTEFYELYFLTHAKLPDGIEIAGQILGWLRFLLYMPHSLYILIAVISAYLCYKFSR